MFVLLNSPLTGFPLSLNENWDPPSGVQRVSTGNWDLSFVLGPWRFLQICLNLFCPPAKWWSIVTSHNLQVPVHHRILPRIQQFSQESFLPTSSHWTFQHVFVVSRQRPILVYNWSLSVLSQKEFCDTSGMLLEQLMVQAPRKLCFTSPKHWQWKGKSTTNPPPPPQSVTSHCCVSPPCSPAAAAARQCSAITVNTHG